MSRARRRSQAVSTARRRGLAVRGVHWRGRAVSGARPLGRLRDRGSASVLVLAMAAVVGLAGGVAAELALSVAARHHLATVADASSLAAAAVVDDGPQAACARARSVARRNRVALANCRVTGSVVTVRLRARLGWPLGWLPPMTLNSRAGPAETITDHSGQAAAAS